MNKIKITNKEESKSLNKYLHDISKIPLLNKEKEKKIAKIIKKGINAKTSKKYKYFKKKAQKLLIKSNLRFVVAIAKQYQNQGLSLSDLINEGNLGLIKAALRFDVKRGYKFISYAVWWIRQSILQAIADFSKCVRSPTNKIAYLNKINKIYSLLENKLQRHPTIRELSKNLSISEKEIEEILKLGGKHISLDAPLIEGEGINLYDVISSKKIPNPNKSLDNESLIKDIKKCLSILSKREKQVIILSCGLFGYNVMTFEEIAHLFKLTRERVRQIQISAIKKLKKSKKSQILKNYLG
ncbi:MAG: sigma-70 family RNA polymerase sigma factor [Candidatus Shikimatogenerans bostrichidophilus]|nr:MAG: sigma-70 family RNA polymerase sigma factor [Candidatus Shikimatogenerans bostrichidophilus]